MQVADDLKHVISAAQHRLEGFFARGDAAGLAANYTRKGQLLPPNGEVVRGTEAIQAFWSAMLAGGVQGVTLTTLEVEGHGDTATEVGTYAVAATGGQVVDQGKYLIIWKHEHGVWKLHRDIWNSSLPAQG